MIYLRISTTQYFPRLSHSFIALNMSLNVYQVAQVLLLPHSVAPSLIV